MPVHALRRLLPSGSLGDVFLHPQSHQLSVCRTIIRKTKPTTPLLVSIGCLTLDTHHLPCPPAHLVRGQSLSLSKAS